MKQLYSFINIYFLFSLLFSPLAIATVDNADVNTAQVKSVSVVNQVNINTATAEQLQKNLIGIGSKKAEAIIQYREKFGAFTAPQQLLEVSGFGQATLEKNQDRIVLE